MIDSLSRVVLVVLALVVLATAVVLPNVPRTENVRASVSWSHIRYLDSTGACHSHAGAFGYGAWVCR